MDLEECQVRAEAAWLEGWREGPTKTRWTSLPLQVGDSAPDVGLLAADRTSVSSRSFWESSPALIIFWRHFGCGCGLDRNRRLRQELPDYQGAKVVIVGQGEPEQAAAYSEKYELPVPIYSDPGRKAYSAFGLLDGLPEQIFYDASEELLLRDWEAGRTFAATRKEQGRSPVDSPWQLPGEFVIDREGKVRLAYRYQYCEDFPDPRVIASALKHL